MFQTDKQTTKVLKIHLLKNLGAKIVQEQKVCFRDRYSKLSMNFILNHVHAFQLKILLLG